MPTLELWQTYDREAVHDIFSPDTTFTPQTGSWGISGMVRLETKGDWAFFVTFGQSQGDHDFEEEITEDGVFTWQSQPRYALTSPVIQELVAHDDLANNIHLFLRTKSGVEYTYFGRLGYLEHDPNKERPVYFTWQLMDWPPPPAVLAGLSLAPTPAPTTPPPLPTSNTLTQTPPPAVKPTKGAPSSKGGGGKATLAGQDAKNRALGLAGEKLVLAHEAARLTAAGRTDLVARIVHTALVEGDSAGYDIRSFNDDGSDRHIEVKTTKGPSTNAFFISPNELDFSDKHAASYVILRLHGYDSKTNSAYFFEIPGRARDALSLKPSEYRARLLPTTT